MDNHVCLIYLFQLEYHEVGLGKFWKKLEKDANPLAAKLVKKN
jgi:hypothetical protein